MKTPKTNHKEKSLQETLNEAFEAATLGGPCPGPDCVKVHNVATGQCRWLRLLPLPADEPLEWLQPMGHSQDTGHRNPGSRSMDDGTI
jgi:hypothetical protein